MPYIFNKKKIKLHFVDYFTKIGLKIGLSVIIQGSLQWAIDFSAFTCSSEDPDPRAAKLFFQFLCVNELLTHGCNTEDKFNVNFSN